MKRVARLLGFLGLVCLLASCGKRSFITDTSYRQRVEQDFNQKKERLPQGDLFAIFDTDLTSYEREALEFLYAYMPLADIADYSGEFHLAKEERKSLNTYTDRKSTLTLPLYKKMGPLESSEFTSIFSKLISANIDKYQQKETQDQALLSPLECQELFFRLLSFVQVFQPQRNSSELLAANIMEYILQNFHTQLTLESIADYFNFHPVHIIRCLKREYGITPNKAVIQVRIDNAKKMLITSNLSINKISDFVGFSSPSYFNKVFREYTGMTPKEYRVQKRPGI